MCPTHEWLISFSLTCTEDTDETPATDGRWCRGTARAERAAGGGGVLAGSVVLRCGIAGDNEVVVVRRWRGGSAAAC